MHLSYNTLLQGGKYRIVRFISAGGFGCTYEAVHVMLGRRVAIKEFFVKDFCNRDESTSHVTVGTQSKVALVSKLKRKFLEEAIALSKFHNENIVQVTDVFEENGTAYYVMDYVNGKSIQDILKTENMITESRAVKYICQVANALKYVHSQNRLHLDIKPGNIMIDEHDNAILIDFGTSKQYDEEDGENTSTLLGKTPGYAPIEQMGNSVQTFTPATDIYSLGATLYKMLSGNTPPEANILVADDESLKPLPSYITAETRNAVEWAMRVKRKERPQSIDQFLNLIKTAKPLAVNVTPKVETTSEETILAVEEKKISEPPKPSIKDSKPEPKVETNYEVEEERSYSKYLLIGAAIVGLLLFILFNYNGNNNQSTYQETLPAKEIETSQLVDLGLSVYWGGYNVGASAPEEYGDYFAWGEITPKNNYTEENSKMNNIDEEIGGNFYKDAVTANWGGKWRLPTFEDLDELCNKCSFKWTIYKGTNGYKVTGPNGKSIFLPASGRFCEKEIEDKGVYGDYWTSSYNSRDLVSACILRFNSQEAWPHGTYRALGLSVRGVMDK